MIAVNLKIFTAQVLELQDNHDARVTPLSNLNPFAEALAAYDSVRLRAAFDACSKVGDGYDRTTLNQWMKGSVPGREDFVRLLAAELGDDDLFAAWQEAREQRSQSAGRSVITRFGNLSHDDKDWVFHQIRRDYLSSTFPSERRQLRYEIQIDDPATPDDDHLVVHLTMTWSGAIAANTTVQYTTTPTGLGEAYDDLQCLFREELAFEPDRLQELLSSMDPPVVGINPLGQSVPTGGHHVGVLNEAGVVQFGNEAASNARVQLQLSYPYPTGQPSFFIRHGKYQVPDTVEINLTLKTEGASSLKALPFMPPGRQRGWAATRMGPKQLFVSLGTDNTVFGDGDGIAFYWTQR